VASVKPNPALDHLWKSIDFGAHWTVIDGNGLPAGVPVNVIKSDPVPDPAAPSRVLYAGTHLGLYRSTDGGASWSRFGSGLPLVSVTDLYISPNEGIVRVATFGRGFWELQLPPRDFTIDASPDSLTIEQGASATAAISTTVTVGTAQQLALTVAGLPTGATAAFAPASITAGAGSTVTVTVGATTPPGTYALTATASGPGATHTAPISLTVTAQADFTINTNPTDLTIMQGQHGTAAVTTAVSFGATQPIGLTAIDLPAATAASFAPTTVPAGSSSTVTIAVGATAPPGTYAVTVRGTGTFASHTAALSLTVVAAPDFAISAAPDSLAMKPGTSGTTTISTTVTLGPAPTVALAISGLPAGATGTFATPTVTAGDSVALTIACDATTAPGTYPLTIQGSATATHTATVTLIVIGPPDFSLTAAPTDLTVAQGASGSAAITPAIINNSPAQVVALAVTGLPKGATGALTPTSVTTGTGATLAITVGGDTAPGSYPLTITGTGTSATHTATVTLEVIAGPGDGGCCSATPADPRGHAVVLFGAVGFAWVRRRRRAPRAGR
jgi:MYXO-CTERM domain-containing protein